MLLLLFTLSAFVTPSLNGSDVFTAGHAAERNGSYQNAAQLFLECARQSEVLRPYALSRAAQNLARTGDLVAAANQFEEVLRDYPEGPWIRLTCARLGYLYVQAGQTEKAFQYFSRVLDGLEPQPWFLHSLALNRARNALTMPAHAKEGYAFFRNMVLTTLHTQDRIEAARLLLGSPDGEDRLWGIYGLVRAGNLKEGRTALEKENLSLQGTERGGIALSVLDTLLGAVLQEPAAWTGLESYARENSGTLPVRLWLMLTLREQALEERPALAENLTNLMLQYFNEGRDAGDACWWLAERYEKKPDIPSADRMYHCLIERCPGHVRVPRSKLYLANHARGNGLPDEAMTLYLSLADTEPKGQFAAESYYRCAQIARESNDDVKVREYLARAADVGLGHFYAHHALYSLQQYEGASRENTRSMQVLSGDSFIRAFPFQEDRTLNLMTLIEHFPAYPRLRFFGENGYEEGEWESLYCILTSAKSLEKLWYPAIAEAGYMHTLIQYVTARGWGVKGGKPTLLRQRLDYPLAYWKAMKATGASLRIDPYFLLAIARQESTFRAAIESGAGACGVLQMMPDTATWLVGVDNRVTADQASNLKSPAASIHLGGVYLNRMLERYSYNAIYALASYNAGPGNCNKWRKKFPDVSMETFMESIPYPETNEYVKKVLANYAAYYSLYPPPEQAETYTLN